MDKADVCVFVYLVWWRWLSRRSSQVAVQRLGVLLTTSAKQARTVSESTSIAAMVLSELQGRFIRCPSPTPTRTARR